MERKKRNSGINKKDLTERLAVQANIPKIRAAEYINIITNIISEALQDGRKVTISDFGTFNLSERTAFRGYDPRNEKRIHVPRRVIPVFRAGKQLKNALSLPQIKNCTLKGTKEIVVEFNKLIQMDDENLLQPSSYSIQANRISNCEIIAVESGVQDSMTRSEKGTEVSLEGYRTVRLTASHHLHEGGFAIEITQSIRDVDGNDTERPISWPRN